MQKREEEREKNLPANLCKHLERAERVHKTRAGTVVTPVDDLRINLRTSGDS
jgi:hypothetical protein